MRWDTEKSICAVASGSSGALRGIVRMSGPDAMDILKQLVSASHFKGGVDFFKPHSASKSARRSPAHWSIRKDTSIPCDLWIWPTQQSFTGQPTVEFHLIGSLPLLGELTKLLCSAGARMAEPGEFTFRAFLAGRMDLAQCEGLLGVIHAENRRNLELALRQLSGGIAPLLQHVRQQLIELTADIEAGLDFVDEDIEFVTQADIAIRIEEAIHEVQKTRNRIESRNADSLARTAVVIGLPNVGKSSLINRLLGKSLSLISSQAGTTRDYLRGRLEDSKLDLVDTAGFESIQGNSPEAIAQELASSQIADSHLCLYCIDSQGSIDQLQDQLQKALEIRARRPTWIVLTKCDVSSLTPSAMAEGLESIPIAERFSTSVQTGHDIERLTIRLREFDKQDQEEVASLLPTTADRCCRALEITLGCLQQALDCVKAERGDEWIAGELRLALDQLGIVAGEVYTDDILDALFSRFCIGK